MVKIKKQHILFLFLVITLITISSCTKPECKTSADCGSRTCYLSKCEEKKCVYTLQRNCCGNRINESIEDGKPGSQCTCPKDYGKCEGKGKIKIGSRLEDATYVYHYCNAENKCILGINEKDIAMQNFLDTINTGIFKASSVVKYNKPFDVSKDKFEFTVTLEDIKKELVLPIMLTKIRLLYNSENTRTDLLIAEKELDGILNGIGDQTIMIVPLNLNYRPKELEEAGSLRYSIDYIHLKQVSTGRTVNGTTLYTNETVRGTFSATKPVLFVRTE